MGDLTQGLSCLLDSRSVGVLATERPNGRPSQSVVYYAREANRLLISSVEGRNKVEDVERTGWASLNVMGEERPFPSATFSGRAEILRRGIGAATAAVAQRLMGADEPPEEQTDEELASVGRVVIAITIDRVAAVNYVDG
jgi:PPOX class probable F420-dependent enzyme